MADLLKRAVDRFSEICDLTETEQASRLEAIQSEDRALHAKVQELLLGDREPDERLDRKAEEFVTWEDIAAKGWGEMDPGEVFERLSDRGGTIDHYRLEREIARGGMGVILEVWDEDLERKLAMKVVDGRSKTPSWLGSRRFLRFFDEARVTSQLDHPGIVPVHDVGIDADGRAYFTMKLVKGRTLEEVFRLVTEEGEQWNQTRALHVLLRVCEAMAYAHAKGVVHRDLKPSNVMVGRFGEVYVMDWGVAWLRSRSDDRDLRPKMSAAALEQTGEIRTGTSVVTMDGTVVGTPYYMSPEQARAGLVDERSDVYAWGSMLYTLLAGHSPYRDDEEDATPHEILARVIAGPPLPIHRVKAGTPAALEAICQKAMARASEERYANMAEVADDLRAYLEGRVVQAHKTGAVVELRKWVERNRSLAGSLAAGVLILVAGLAVSLAQWTRAENNAQLAEDRRQIAEAKALEAESERARVVRLLASFRLDGRRREADELWPAHPKNMAKYEEWLAKARALVSELNSNADGRVPADRARLAELRSRALPASTAELGGEQAVLDAKLAAFRRAEDLRHGRAEAEEHVLDEAALPDDPDALNRRAWDLVRPGRRTFGRESEGLAIAWMAMAGATSDSQLANFGDTLAWALFANGRDAEAIVEGEAALEAAGVAGEGRPQTSLDELRKAIELTANGEALEALEQERESKRTWRFADEEDALWHTLLVRLIEGTEILADPETGLIEGSSAEHGWGIVRRKRWAEEVEELTVTGTHPAKLWADAIASIRDTKASPMYAGLEITPQIGLIPLGRDPDSGLFEFGHPATGLVPERDGEGRIVPRAETGLVFVLLPGGTFSMGAQSEDSGGRNHDPLARLSEGPVHEVTLSPSFLSKYEMTQRQWLRFTGQDPSLYRAESGSGITAAHPVERVSWRECQVVCRRLGLRLPTEAEWEFAARAGTTTAWSTGEARETLIDLVNLADRAAQRVGAPWPAIGDWPELDDGFPVHAPVAAFDANPYGFHEVHGNVWEWCQDAFEPDFYLQGEVFDPLNGGAVGDNRVYRGGSFRQTSAHARSASRGNDAPDAESSYIGLRPARSIDP